MPLFWILEKSELTNFSWALGVILEEVLKQNPDFIELLRNAEGSCYSKIPVNTVFLEVSFPKNQKLTKQPSGENQSFRIF